jgi:hypothetical protein
MAGTLAFSLSAEAGSVLLVVNVPYRLCVLFVLFLLCCPQ